MHHAHARPGLRPWTAVIAASAILGGCGPYDGRYSFRPKPAQIELEAPGEDVAAARALVSVIGVRRADRRTATPASVELRIRLENTGHHSLVFDPTSLQLVSADLREFPAPVLDTPEAVEVAPLAPVVVQALFPIDEDGEPRDLSSLQVQWSVAIDGEPLPASVSVKRRRYTYRPVCWCGGWHAWPYRHRDRRWRYGLSSSFHCW